MTSENSNEVNLQIVIKPARPSTLETSNFGINRSSENVHLITFFSKSNRVKYYHYSRKSSCDKYRCTQLKPSFRYQSKLANQKIAN